VLGMPLKHLLGFGNPNENLKFGPSDNAFGWPGARGSFGFADPHAQSSVAKLIHFCASSNRLCQAKLSPMSSTTVNRTLTAREQ
jgi:hypothetical protein